MSKFSSTRWIFIRGLGRATQKWESFIPLFQQAVSKQDPLAQFEHLDLVGNGTRKYEVSALQVAHFLHDLRSRSQFIQNHQKVNLITISLASMVAVDWARKFPHELERIVLMNTSDRQFSKLHERLKIRNVQFLGKILKPVQNTSADLATIEKPSMNLFPDTNRLNFFRQLIAGARYGFPKQKPPGNFLLLSSLGDQLVNPICSERIANSWQIPHSVHPTAPHDIPVHAPEWCVQQILDFALGK